MMKLLSRARIIPYKPPHHLHRHLFHHWFILLAVKLLDLELAPQHLSTPTRPDSHSSSLSLSSAVNRADMDTDTVSASSVGADDGVLHIPKYLR